MNIYSRLITFYIEFAEDKKKILQTIYRWLSREWLKFYGVHDFGPNQIGKKIEKNINAFMIGYRITQQNKKN